MSTWIIVVGGPNKEFYDMPDILNQTFPTNKLGELKLYLGCAFERDWHEGALKVSQL